MATIGIESILTDVAKVDTKDLEAFHKKVGGLLSLRKSRPVKEKEEELVRQIQSEFLHVEDHNRFLVLFKKKELDDLTETERMEYHALLQIIENKSIKRLAMLIELSHLRGASLHDTMKLLGLKAVNPYNA